MLPHAPLCSFLPVYQKLEHLQADKTITSTPGLCTVIAAVSSIPSRSQAMQADLEHLLGKQQSCCRVEGLGIRGFSAPHASCVNKLFKFLMLSSINSLTFHEPLIMLDAAEDVAGAWYQIRLEPSHASCVQGPRPKSLFLVEAVEDIAAAWKPSWLALPHGCSLFV